MIEAIATRNVLIRQERVGNVKKDVSTKRGEKIKLSEEDAIKFWGALEIKENDKKSLLKFARQNGVKRKV